MKNFRTTLLSLIMAGVAVQGRVTSVTSAESSKCLDVSNSNFTNGTAVIMYTCNKSTAQIWELYPGGTEVVIADPDLTTKYCLDAKTVDSSSPVVLWACNGSPWQKWNYTSSGQLALADTNLCLDVPGHSKDDGTQVQTYACNGGLNQQWKLD